MEQISQRINTLDPIQALRRTSTRLGPLILAEPRRASNLPSPMRMTPRSCERSSAGAVCAVLPADLVQSHAYYESTRREWAATAAELPNGSVLQRIGSGRVTPRLRGMSDSDNRTSGGRLSGGCR